MSAAVKSRLNRIAGVVIDRFAAADRQRQEQRPQVIALAPDRDDSDRRMKVTAWRDGGWTAYLRIPAAELGEEIAERHAHHEAGRGNPKFTTSTGDYYPIGMDVPAEIAEKLFPAETLTE